MQPGGRLSSDNQLARGAPLATRTLADGLTGQVSRVGTVGLAALASCAAFLGQHRHHCVKAKPLGDKQYRDVAAQLMRTRESACRQPRSVIVDLLQPKPPNSGLRRILVQQTPARGPIRQPGSMHKSLWDILGTLSPRPIAGTTR